MTVVSLRGQALSPSPVARHGLVTRGRAVVIALLLAAAGAIHLVAAPEHLREFTLFGLAFYAMAAVQFAAAAAFGLGTPSVAVRRAAIVLSLAIAALWATSRLLGLPVGLEPWVPEPVGIEDALCTGLEILAAAMIFAGTISRSSRAVSL
jgi:hypothetical protein